MLPSFYSIRVNPRVATVDRPQPPNARSIKAVATHNGDIAISDVRGQIRFDTHNGAVSLKRLGAHIRAE